MYGLENVHVCMVLKMYMYMDDVYMIIHVHEKDFYVDSLLIFTIIFMMTV